MTDLRAALAKAQDDLVALGRQAQQAMARVDEALVQVEPPPVVWPGVSGWRAPRNTYADVRAFYPALEAWRGRKVHVIGHFIGLDLATSWDRMLANYCLGGTEKDPKGAVQAIYDGGWLCTLGIAPFPTNMARRYDLLARGEFDEQHRKLALRLKEIVGDRRIWVRLGWECNEGYPWSLADEKAGQSLPDTAEWQAHYRTGWARTALIYKQALPGCRTVWNHLRNTRRAMEPYYPGGEAVDVLGMDLYDFGYGGLVADEAAWQRYGGTYDPEAGRFDGPLGLLAFATAKGKPVSICEWGVWNRTQSSTDPGDNPFFISRLCQWFRSLGPSLEYEVYFEAGGKCPQALFYKSGEFDYNPRSRVAYLAALNS